MLIPYLTVSGMSSFSRMIAVRDSVNSLIRPQDGTADVFNGSGSNNEKKRSYSVPGLTGLNNF